MFTLQRTSTARAALRLVLANQGLVNNANANANANQRCLILLVQQKQHFHQGENRFISSAHLSASSAQGSNELSDSITAKSGNVVQTGKKGKSGLPPYMVFRYAQHQSTAQHSTLAYDLTADEGAEVETLPAAQTIASRPLVLLFAWMLSRNSHIEKYRDFWTRRGYDILTVQTSPIDLLVPSVGGKRVASNVFKFLSQISPRYDQVLVHAFSVGGYQLGEFLDRLYQGVQNQEPEAERLFESLKGVVIDSVVFAEDAAPGLSRAVTLNPIVQPILEKSIQTWLNATRRFTFDRYKLVESHVIDNRNRIPSMLLFSKDDVVSNWRSNFRVVESWERKQIPTHAHCWDRSAHVLHYREHPEEYEQVVDRFVARLDISKAPRRDLD